MKNRKSEIVIEPSLVLFALVIVAVVFTMLAQSVVPA